KCADCCDVRRALGPTWWDIALQHILGVFPQYLDQLVVWWGKHWLVAEYRLHLSLHPSLSGEFPDYRSHFLLDLVLLLFGYEAPVNEYLAGVGYYVALGPTFDHVDIQSRSHPSVSKRWLGWNLRSSLRHHRSQKLQSFYQRRCIFYCVDSGPSASRMFR